MLRQLGEGDIAVVGALQQRADGRGLEQHVRLVLGRKLGVVDGLYVQGARQALIDHGKVPILSESSLLSRADKPPCTWPLASTRNVKVVEDPL